MTLALFRWARDRLQPFAQPLYGRAYEKACASYNAATAQYRAAKARGDTRGQHDARQALKPALNEMLRLERQISGRA